MSDETALREAICILAASLFARGFSVGSAGNISVRLTDGFVEIHCDPAPYAPRKSKPRKARLLREFRANHNHMAIVIDEYGGVAGLVTIEDVLEQIVGDIEDEHDVEEDSYIRPLPSGDFLVKALTPIDSFNEYFGSAFPDDEFDTVAGLVMSTFGHLPKRNEVTEIDGFRVRVLNADSRRVHMLRLSRTAGA